MKRNEQLEKIKRFWDTRAEEYGAGWQATLGEKYLRLLEIRTMRNLIKTYNPRNVLDIGCGNGYSTKIFAAAFPSVDFVGLDYSEMMIQEANKSPVKNCKFLLGDVLDISSFPSGSFDLVITQRCLQNLPNYELQRDAIKNLLTRKSPHGTLLLMECSKDGVNQLNRVRQKFGMGPVEGVEPWHNNFFFDNDLIKDFNARVVFFTSTYMFFAKVLSPKLSTMFAVIALNLDLSSLGYLLPSLGKFGYDRLYVIK